MLSYIKPFCPFVQVPRDPEDPQGADRQKEEQRLIDESEPLNEEETAEKEQLLQEVSSLLPLVTTILSNGLSRCVINQSEFEPVANAAKHETVAKRGKQVASVNLNAGNK